MRPERTTAESSSSSNGEAGHQAGTKSRHFHGRPLLVILGGGLLLLIGLSLIAAGPLQTRLSDSAALEKAQSLTDELLREWDSTSEEADRIDLDKARMTRPLGKGFAFIYIPRLGKDWRAVIVNGVDQPTLEGAIGHFPSTALPGMVGNFALAGHRNMDGSLFGNLDQVSKGDSIVVETKDRWITYKVTDINIISPTQVEVLEPVPFKPGKDPQRAVITLTTCHPWWSTAQRLAITGELSDVRLKTMAPPEEVAKAVRPRT